MSFIPRTSKPEAGNKYYIRKANGGYSNAILGNPTDKECNVLANCVGYAYGRFNEIGQYGYCKYLAPVNAENFMDYKGSCETGMTPKVGACMVWEGKGDLAGHVAIVEKVYDNNHVMTSESGYGSSKPFWNQERYNNNGRWGCGTNYPFKGFIYNPAVPDEPPVTPNVERNESMNQVEVLVDQLRVRTEPNLKGQILGFAKRGFYNVYEQKEADGYVWFKIADNQWIATNDGWTKYYPATDYEKLYKEEVEKNKKLTEQVTSLTKEKETLQGKIDKAIEDLK